MDLELKNKKALVSAGHKGIGFFIASRLLEEGAEVSICCRSQTDLDSSLKKLMTKGKIHGYICDFSDSHQVINWVKNAGEAMGGIDICIGNASASAQHGEGADPWRSSFDVDMLGTAMFFETARPFLKESSFWCSFRPVK